MVRVRVSKVFINDTEAEIFRAGAEGAEVSDTLQLDDLHIGVKLPSDMHAELEKEGVTITLEVEKV